MVQTIIFTLWLLITFHFLLNCNFFLVLSSVHQRYETESLSSSDCLVLLWFTLIDSFLKTEIKSAVSMSTCVSVAVTSGQTFLSRKENLTTVARVCF